VIIRCRLALQGRQTHMTFRVIATVLAAEMLTAIGLAAPATVDSVQGPASSEQVRPFCMDDRPETRPESLPYSLLPPELQTQLTALIPADAIEIPDPADGRIVLASPAEIGEPPLHPKTWDLFYARYPGSAGYLLLTVPIFDRSQRQAAVATNHLFGWLGGKGELYLLVRDTSGKWTVKTRWPRWVS
jgi:hypothetical protein